MSRSTDPESSLATPVAKLVLWAPGFVFGPQFKRPD